jgi:hypothetical protein
VPRQTEHIQGRRGEEVFAPLGPLLLLAVIAPALLATITGIVRFASAAQLGG